MIKIYLDNTLLDEDNYISFTVNNKMFDNTFYLGSTPSVEASLTIPSDALPSSITEVEVREDTEVLFNFVVDEITINDDAEAEIKLVDKMILLQKQYDFSYKDCPKLFEICILFLIFLQEQIIHS